MDWSKDELCASLVVDMVAGRQLNSREILKPIYKWMKATGKSYDAEKSFKYVEWLIQLSSIGDDRYQVPKQIHILPKYAYNVIVTMAQRNDSPKEAMRAYHCMLSHGYEPDVFTLTALMDVTGRNGSFDTAMDIYNLMKGSEKSLPNVVTFVTLIRIAYRLPNKDKAKIIVINLIDEAQQLARECENAQLSTNRKSVDISIYNSALSAYVRLDDYDYFLRVLRYIHDGCVNVNQLTLDIVAKFYFRSKNKNGFETIELYAHDLCIKNGLIALFSDAPSLQKHIAYYIELKQTNPDIRVNGYAGCLGPDAPFSLRRSVLKHDIDKLLDRLSQHSVISESDFVTLLHQCRKRKWGDQISFVLDRQREIATIGVEEQGIEPLSYLSPTRISYEAALNGFFHLKSHEDAWNLYQDCLHNAEFCEDIWVERFYYVLISGFLRCGQINRVQELYSDMLSRHIHPSDKLLLRIMRGSGKSIDFAIQVIQDSSNNSHKHQLEIFICTVIESCAVLGHPKNIPFLVKRLKNHEYTSIQSCMQNLQSSYSKQFIVPCLMGICTVHSAEKATKMLWEWQLNGLLPRWRILYYIIVESIWNCIDGKSQDTYSSSCDTLPCKGFRRVGACNEILERSDYIGAILKLYHDCWSVVECDNFSPDFYRTLFHLEDATIITRNLLAFPDTCLDHFASEAAQLMNLFTSELSPELLKLLSINFLAYVYARMLSIRSKVQKDSLINEIATVIGEAISPVNFLQTVFRSLYLLRLSSKEEGKLIGIIMKALPALVDCSEKSDILQFFAEYGIGLDVMKEVNRACEFTSDYACKYELYKLLEAELQREEPHQVKVLQTIQHFALLDMIDVNYIENWLIASLGLDDEKSGEAIFCYLHILKSCRNIQETCKRIAKELIKNDKYVLATKILSKHKVTNCDEFKWLMSQSANGDTVRLAKEFTPLENYGYLTLPNDTGVILVNNRSSLEFAYQTFHEYLDSQDKVYVGLDAEWRPYSLQQSFSKCSLLQIACPHHVFLFDLMILERNWFKRKSKVLNREQGCQQEDEEEESTDFLDLAELESMFSLYEQLISFIFQSSHCIILGYHIFGDIRRLSESFPYTEHYKNPTSIHELSTVCPHTRGLSGLCVKLLNLQLDKRMQTSDWEQRPLSAEQIQYAALDSYCLLLLHQQMQQMSLQRDEV